MLRAFKPSGEEVLAIQFAKFVEVIDVPEQPVRALDLKRHLQGLCGQPRFKQRLLLADGQTLSDDDPLNGPLELQLILLPFITSSDDDMDQL